MLTDADLIARLTTFEDAFVERKSKSDKGEWLKAIVAFANSTPIGYPATLFIGVDDTGQIVEQMNVENTIKSVSDLVGERAWPPIYMLPRVLSHEGKSCIAVIVPGSPERPHFAGKSYVRAGTQTKDASEQNFAELIAQRSSKARELQRFAGRQITFVNLQRNLAGAYTENYASQPVYIETCNSHFATLKRAAALSSSGTSYELESYALSRIELEFDCRLDRPRIRVYSDR